MHQKVNDASTVTNNYRGLPYHSQAGHRQLIGLILACDELTVFFLEYSLDVDVDVEIRQAQARPLSLFLTYTLLIHVAKLPIKLISAPGSVQFRSVVIKDERQYYWFLQ